ncbi:chemotaxis protein CheW [Aliikangiella sp. IMCC44359]|uniref:chemotaxis protein CheW n=1 Tax=Aliikangiella sp. IMCC44359 TaxID=3459125 RepID=UPI00403ADCA2
MSDLMHVIQEQEIDISNTDVLDHETGTQYLSFIVGGEIFAVDILSVQEIRAWESPTFLPNSPTYVKGVLNLRGTIVPVIDLRNRFDFKQIEYSETTVIIILKNTSLSKERLMGCVVDGVSDVLNIDDESINELPNNHSNIDTRFTEGVANVDEHAVTLLNLANLLSLKLIQHPFSGQG